MPTNQPHHFSVQVPVPLDLAMSPWQVADGLRHLSGMVFFDTSGNLPTKSHSPISIIAARPVEILRGDIRDVSELQCVMASAEVDSSSLGFPAGGLCGWVDYEGAYCFGVYPEMLIYQHDAKQWWQCGSLADAIKKTEGEGAKKPYVGAFSASMSQSEYEDGVRRIQEYIAAGDIYQVNLTQRFLAPVQGDSLFDLYKFLRSGTPAPQSVWMHLAGREVLSSSPEIFLKMSGRGIETRPIKGTRPRVHDIHKDREAALDLLESEKEKSELVMITDLERNDLGQVCDFGSVRVVDMLTLEELEHVYHLVSTVTGTLREEVDHLEALQACFPGGSITGAPKKRAMEIISELEPVPRGLYTGALGYIGFNGESQLSIPIRTLVREGDTLQYHVGAGIVADSDPAAEYQETLQKAKGIRLAIKAFSE